MRFDAKGTLLVLLLCAGSTRAGLGQENLATSKEARPVAGEDRIRQQKALEPRLLTASEGLAILGEALDFRHHANFPSDCSHFVHELYKRAGFPYDYASSADLYAGVDEFRRVTNPQPGDLAVWRGHAGIVVNPAQHSFFSALSSGHGVDSYDSPYWKQRGRPRFFRYVKSSPGGVLSSSIRTASLRPTALSRAEAREALGEDSVSDRSEESASEVGASAKLVEKQPKDPTTPLVPIVDSARPKASEVGAAFLDACKGWEESLDGRDLFKLDRPVIVFDHFEARKVHIAGSQGWVEVQMDQLVSLTGSKPEVRKRQRWPLTRRDDQSWELIPPRNMIYLPQHIAERILVHQLARLTEDSPDNAGPTQEKAELARVLGVLLGK